MIMCHVIMSLWLKRSGLKEELSPGRASLSFTFKNQVDWWADYAFARATSPSTFDPRNVMNVERGGEVSPSTRGTIFSGFRRLSTQWKAGDERQLREVSYFNLFSLWEMKRRSQSAKCQRTETHTRARAEHTPAILHNHQRTHIPPVIESWRGKKKTKRCTEVSCGLLMWWWWFQLWN